MNTISTYLKNLKFDKNLERSFKVKYLTNIRIVILLLILIVVLGIVSFFSLPKRLNPEIKIPIISIVTALPGAPPKDVEKLITKPLENSISPLKGISELNSISNDSVSIITIQFNSNINADKAKDDTQSAVDLVELPSDAKTPTVKKFDFEDTPVFTFSLKGKDRASQEEVANRIKKSLEDNPFIDRVIITGLDTQEIQIIAKEEAINTYSINPLALSKNIQSSLSAYPGGIVSTGNLDFPIGINSQINSIENIRETLITVNNEQIKLGDITQIMERPSINQKQAFYATQKIPPKNVVTFSVYKTSTSTIDKGVEEAKKSVNKVLSQSPKGFEIITISDYSKDIDIQFEELIYNFRDTLILVFLTFLIFLGIRQAIIAVLTIPLTFLITFTIINYLGISLNFLTLFSLLLSLGLLVDDTIVIVTGMTSYYRTKKFTPTQTGLLVWRDFIVPIWTTTITTVWAFIPLLLSTGIIGEFIKTIPIVVSITLYSSTAIAVLITLPLMISILKLEIPKRVIFLLKVIIIVFIFTAVLLFAGNTYLTPLILLVLAVYIYVTVKIRKKLINRTKSILPFNFSVRERLDNRLLDIEKFSNLYKKFLMRVLSSKSARKKVLTAISVFVVFSFLLIPLGFVVNEFFPKSENDYIYVNIELPNGSSIEKTTQKALIIFDSLRKTDGIAYSTLEIGESVVSGFSSSNQGSNNAKITLNLPEKNMRKINSLEIANKLRANYKNYKDAKVSIVEQSGGPPAGADISISLLGDDFSVLDTITNKLIAFLEKEEGVINIEKSIKPGTSKLSFIPDKDKLSIYGISMDTIGLYLRMYATGLPIDTVSWNGSDIDIVFKTGISLKSPEELGNINIPNMNNEQIPLLSLGKFRLETNPTSIAHNSTKRELTVTAAVSKGYNSTKVNTRLLKFANSINLPDGYQFKTGGANEENQKSVESILRAMLISAMLIITTMVIQFRSYRKAAIAISIIPVAISGVFVVFAITSTPLSFPALIGVLSLFGIVVTHSMMLIDKINRNLSFGMPFKEAISDGAASRLEPVAIGSFTTIVGLIPITLSNPLWRGLGGAIIAGLTFSGIIMLFLIPVIYYYAFEDEYKNKNHISKH